MIPQGFIPSIEKGVRGELLRQPWFYQLRATQPDVVVFVSFAVAFVLSGLLFLISSNFVADLLTIGLWTGVAYLYFLVRFGVNPARRFFPRR